MATDNNSINLILRAQQLTYHREKLSVGKVYNDVAVEYNNMVGSSYPYIQTSDYRNAVGYPNFNATTRQARYIFPMVDDTAPKGIRFSHDYTVYNPYLLIDKDASAEDDFDYHPEWGTFIIGPEGPYNNYIINRSQQPAYWQHVNPSGFFDLSYIDFESTGTQSFSYDNGSGLVTADVPRIYDKQRGQYCYPNGIFSTNHGLSHGVADFTNTDNYVNSEQTRSLRFTTPDVVLGSGDGINNNYDNLLKQSYNLGDVSLDGENDFSIYLKFKPEEYRIPSGSSNIGIFNNNCIKIGLIPFEAPPNNGDHNGKYKIAIYGRTNRISDSMPINFDSTIGFEPDPGARNSIRHFDPSGSNYNDDNIMYQWLGSDTDLMMYLNSGDSSSWANLFSFGLNSLINPEDANESFQWFKRLEQTTSYGTVAVGEVGEEEIDAIVPDTEMDYWWNWGIVLPRMIHVGETTSLVVSYAASGAPTRNDLLFRKWRNPYTSGIISEEPSTLSIMYNHDPVINTHLNSQLNALSLDNDDDDTTFRSLHDDINYTDYSSYDIQFPYPTLVGLSETKPFCSLSDISDAWASKTNKKVYGYSFPDYAGSGYLGDSNFSGSFEEFGMSNSYLSPDQRKSLVDNVKNLGGLLYQDTDGTFTSASNKVSLVVSSGDNIGQGENLVGGRFNADYTISSSLDIPITNYPLLSTSNEDAVFIWDMFPFPDPDDLLLNCVVSHTYTERSGVGGGPPIFLLGSGVQPTIYCDIVDKATDEITQLAYGGIVIDPDGGNNANRIAHHSLNQAGIWNSHRITLQQDQNISKVTFSGVFDGGCGNWDLRDKIIKFNVEYDSQGRPFDSQLDLYAMDLRVDWFKIDVEVTGDDNPDYDLYIKGVQFTTGTNDANLFTISSGTGSEIDLYMEVDRGPSSGEIPLYIYSSATPSGFQDLESTDLTIRGASGIYSDTTLFTKFEFPSSAIPLYMGDTTPDSIKTINNNTLFIDGQYVDPSGRDANLYVYGTTQYGDVDPTTVVPLYIKVKDEDDAIDPTTLMDLFITGSRFNTTNSVNLSILNHWSGDSGSTDLFIKKEGVLDGGYAKSGDIPLYIERVPADEGLVQLSILGHDSPISSGVNLFLTGTLPTSTTDADMFLANYESNNSLDIYMRGFK